MSKFSGAELTGMRIDGAAFMTPNDLNATIWLPRGIGVTHAGGVISAWADASPAGKNFTAFGSPSYNSSTGIVSLDGVNDRLENSANPPNDTSPELVIVVRFPVLERLDTLVSVNRASTVDADAGKWNKASTGVLNVSANVAGGVITSTQNNAQNTVIANKWYVLHCARPNFNRIYSNGVQLAYSILGAFNWANDSGTRRIIIGAEARNSGGNPTTPINFGKIDIADFAYFPTALNSIQRGRLVNYYHNQYSDLNI